MKIENAAHPFELPKVHYTVVRASMQQMGVGGDDSWGDQNTSGISAGCKPRKK